MDGYARYVEHLERLALAGDAGSRGWGVEAHAALNGGPGHELQQCLTVEERRRSGAFFTSHALAGRLVRLGCREKETPQRYFDPACGAGELLLAAAARLPVSDDLGHTLALWGRHLAGCDVREEFVRATRARLALLATKRGARRRCSRPVNVERAFHNIRVGDGLASNNGYDMADRILLNPPFHAIRAPVGCGWATGSITAAALFVDCVLEFASPGTQVDAILPDVLRSGSRYAKWRQSVEQRATVQRVDPHGQFGDDADIDVFLLSLAQGASGSSAEWHRPSVRGGTHQQTVGDRFLLRVGTVVPHRDQGSGPPRPFLTARGLPRWCTCEAPAVKRRCDGPGFLPPFVAVRRTSRPDRGRRAVATVVTGQQEVSVENHLIVLLPLEGNLSTCGELMERLGSRETDSWLNYRIRCRHLTVSALAEIPWWE
jgi:hypothetical protein